MKSRLFAAPYRSQPPLLLAQDNDAKAHVSEEKTEDQEVAADLDEIGNEAEAQASAEEAEMEEEEVWN